MLPSLKTRSLFTRSAVVLTGLLVSAQVTQAEQGQWFINPMVGYQWFDSDRVLDDDSLLGLGLEYQYGDRWAVELKYLDSSLDGDDNAANDADLGQLMIEGMYLLGKQQKFQPYLAAGLGHADFDYDLGGANEETQATAGAGMRYWLNDRWSTKADLRWVHSIDNSDNDSLFTVAISYAFGKASAAKVMPAAGSGDSDGDGVTDDRDQCADTPAGIQIDASGCALDSDGDGVADHADQCPNTVAGAAVDSEGCAKKLTRTENISLNVQFASNRAEVSAAYLEETARVARFMKSYSTVSGTIEGHTDDTGAAAYNESLSQRRADAVRQVLIEQYGIAASRLNAVGYGEAKPVADNGTAEGRQQNRRVVAVFEAEVTE